MYSDEHDFPMFRSPYELLKFTGAASSTVRYYHAGTNDRYFYPYRLQPADPKTASSRQREQSISYIIDSDFNNPDVTNRDVIEHAVDKNATHIVPKDYVSTPDNDISVDEARRKTTESIGEFLELYDVADVGSTPIIPLQPPHAEHYETITDRFGEFGYYAVGGVAKKSVETKIEAARSTREVVGPYRDIHGFGFGPTFKMIQTLRDEPGLLDSIDSSTLENNSVAGSALDKWGDSASVPIAKGDDTTSVHGSIIQFGLTHINYMLSPYCDDDDLEEEFERIKALRQSQAGVGDF